MDNKVEKGIIKIRVDKIALRDFNAGNTIKNALVNEGFDLTIEPVIDKMNMQVGETITIYRIEKR